MLHIILLILKIIGIIFLALLGLLLLVILAALFVPLRYRVKAAHGDGYLELDATASWLLHLLHARVTMENKKPHIRVRIFGILLFDNLKEKKDKTTKNKAEKTRTKAIKAKKAKTGKATDREINSGAGNEKSDNYEESSLYKGENIPSGNEPEDDITSFEAAPRDENFGIKNKKKSIFQRIYDKLKTVGNKICTFFQKLKERIRKWLDNFLNIKRKVTLLIEFVKDEINREAFKITYSSLIKILKHILPTKLRSSIRFGTGDPCSTGQILGVLAILYSFYGDRVSITPDFENKCLEGRHEARGRIRLVTILIIVIKLMLNKRFKQLWSNMKTLKEAL